MSGQLLNSTLKQHGGKKWKTCGLKSKTQPLQVAGDMLVEIDDDPPTSSMLIAEQRAFLQRQLNHLGGQNV